METEGEEKKEETRPVVLGGAAAMLEEKGLRQDETDEDSDVDGDFCVLPSDIATLVGGATRKYKDERELQDVFDEKGLGDLNVILVNGEARLVMVKHQHNMFTTKYLQDLIESHGKWIRYLGPITLKSTPKARNPYVCLI